MSLRDAISSIDLLVVGSGFFGLTIAQQAVEQLNARVLIMERRSHFGGNAYSFVEPQSGIEVHKYGSHIFHTSNERVWTYINRFGTFNDYRHTVWTNHKNKIYSMPINLLTLSQFYGRALTPGEADQLIKAAQDSISDRTPRNLEEKAISLIGKDLYEAFIKGYTYKQWEIDPKELPPEIITRLPVRRSFNTRYFDDPWEGIPVDGYTRLMERMINSDNIMLELGVDFFDWQAHLPQNLPVVYTGPLDRYFNYSEGRLSWRTLDLDMEVVETPDFQGTSVMNFADMEIPYTRIHDFRHFHPERDYQSNLSVIMKEYSRKAIGEDEPYYPVNATEDRQMLERYRDRIRNESNVVFGGRLGTYKYLDMHMAIASALSIFSNRVEGLIRARRAIT